MFTWLIISLKLVFKIICVSLKFELCNTHNYSIVCKIILTHYASKWFNSSSSHSESHHNNCCELTRCPWRVLQLCDYTIHNSQLNVITLHFTITCIITLRNILILRLFTAHVSSHLVTNTLLLFTRGSDSGA